MLKFWGLIATLAANAAAQGLVETTSITATNTVTPSSVAPANTVQVVTPVVTPAAALFTPASSPSAASVTGNLEAAASTSSAAGKQSTTDGTNPIVIKGYRFFDSVTGEYFGVRGVDYYPRPNTGTLDMNNLDLFSNQFNHIWARDIPQFVALSANTIRLYAVDPEANHDEFMCMLQAAGVYVIVELGSSCDGCEITADAAPACYPDSYKTRGEKIIQAFAKYDNVLGFSGGNEINHRTNGKPSKSTAPCQKKFVRDMRQYIRSCPKMRQIPVGLVVADTERDANAEYYNCRTNPDDELETAEWYGINTYVHCDDISDPAKAAGFNALRDSFKSYKYSIPVILTEFGCLSNSFPTVDGYEGQRTFHDAKFMNLPEYSDYFAGGFAFEYSTENANSKDTSPYPFQKIGPQNYGLGYFAPENCDDVTIKCEFVRMPNYHFLAEAYNTTTNQGQPTYKTFEATTDRTQPTQCPSDFPKLSEFTWAGDSSESQECPQVARFQCPNVRLNLDIAARDAREVSTSNTTATNTNKGTDTLKTASKEVESKQSQAKSGASVDGLQATVIAAVCASIVALVH